MVSSSLKTRNVRIGHKRTSVRLEGVLWEALDEIVRRESVSLNEICTKIHRERSQVGEMGGFTSALRVYVVKYFREMLHVSANSEKGTDQGKVLHSAVA